jgi:phytoene/squalene synthetase
VLYPAYGLVCKPPVTNRRCTTDAKLNDYCTRWANPVGRLMLHWYGTDETASLAQSDPICTALQLINLWQDVTRSRWYPSQQIMTRFGVTDADLQPHSKSECGSFLIAY